MLRILGEAYDGRRLPSNDCMESVHDNPRPVASRVEDPVEDPHDLGVLGVLAKVPECAT
jgi:hypothetical protein